LELIYLKQKKVTKINQTDYIEKIINKYNMNKTRILKYPVEEFQITKELIQKKKMDINKYQSLLGSLIYIYISKNLDQVLLMLLTKHQDIMKIQHW